MKVILISLLFSPFVMAESFLPSSFQASFIQKHKSSITKKVREGRGTIAYSFPQHLRFEVKEPDEVLFITNGKKSWYYTPPFIEGEPGELTISRGTDNALLEVLDSLKWGLVSNKLYRVDKKPDQQKVILEFKNQEENQQIKIVELSFRRKKMSFSDLKSMRLHYVNKKQVDLIFESVNFHPTFTQETFHFVSPKGVKINSTHLK